MDACDVLIVGGGLVGSSLAIALHGGARRVMLAEATLTTRDVRESRDQRYLALARATVNALQALAVWPHCAARAHPLRRIHVSREGEFGVLRLDARRHGVDAFGATLPAHALGTALQARLRECAGVEHLIPARLEALHDDGAGIAATLSTPAGPRNVRARLVVGADGTQSAVRQALGIDCESFDYAQTAVVATVASERAVESAYERFGASGPLAVLPLADGRAGVVMTVPAHDAQHVAALDDTAFLALLQERFGWRLGRFTHPGRRSSHALRRVSATRLVAPRGVLVGNAAQTLHPIGAQGFNLGLRDALTLAELLLDGDADPGNPDLLAAYVARRRVDRDATAATSDALARWTARESPPLKLLRSAGLLAFDRVPVLQAALVRRGMGFRGTVPRLALGGTRA